MRLAVVVRGFPILSETFVFNLVTALREAGLDVTIVTQRRSTDRPLFADRIVGDGPACVDGALAAYGRKHLARQLAVICSRSPLLSWQLWRRVRKRHRDTEQAFRTWLLALPLVTGRYDIIHFAFSGLAVSYLNALPFVAPAKLLVSCRGADEQIRPLMDPRRPKELRQLFSLVNRVHCVSTDIQRTAAQYGLCSEHAFVIRPAIRVAQFRRVQPYPLREKGPYQLLSVARLHWKKGLEYGLLALRQLVDDGYDVRYDIIGEGAERESLPFAIHDLGLTEHVRLRGPQSPRDVQAALAAADIFLLPSLSEGLSNAALEAMAMELPLVATTAGGMAEAVTDEREGFLVRPRQPKEMAARVRQLLNDPALRLRMGQAGRQRIVQDFNLESQIHHFVAEYHAMLGA